MVVAVAVIRLVVAKQKLNICLLPLPAIRVGIETVNGRNAVDHWNKLCTHVLATAFVVLSWVPSPGVRPGVIQTQQSSIIASKVVSNESSEAAFARHWRSTKSLRLCICRIWRVPVYLPSGSQRCGAILIQQIAASVLVIGRIAAGKPRISEDIVAAIQVWEQLCQVSIFHVPRGWVAILRDCNLCDPHLPAVQFGSTIDLLAKHVHIAVVVVHANVLDERWVAILHNL